MEWSFVGVGPVHADVEVASGRIDVQAVARDEAHVTLEPAKSGSRRAQELIEASTVSLDSGKLRVHVPSRTFKNTDVLCTIVIPEGSSLTVKTASADTRCTGRLGEFTTATASADTFLDEVDGAVTLTTASGDFSARSVGGRLKAKGASADIVVGSVGGAVDIVNASGDVIIKDAAQSVNVRTASGDLALGCAHEGDITVRSASGDVTIGVARGSGALLDVTSLSGEMSCTLPFEETAPGDAKLRITCRAVSGDVRIEAAGV